jgi:hypothetical protein
MLHTARLCDSLLRRVDDGRQYSGHGALGCGHSAPGMSSATDCKSGPCVAGQDGTEMGNQAAEQLVGGDRCLKRQLVSAGLSHRRPLGPGSTALYVGLITRRSEVRILSPLPQEAPLGAPPFVLRVQMGFKHIASNPWLPKWKAGTSKTPSQPHQMSHCPATPSCVPRVDRSCEDGQFAPGKHIPAGAVSFDE